MQNTDQLEVEKFSTLANSWWDPEGDLRTLHDINPIRVDYILKELIDAGVVQSDLKGVKLLDVGCGGGILSEALAAQGADVTGIDASEASLEIAKMHLIQTGQKVLYLVSTAEEYAESHAKQYDVITCLEMLEHVPDPASVIRACAAMVKPGGHLFFSTLSRTPKAYMLAVLGAEYIMSLIPKGTHDYAKFIKPHELSHWLRDNALETLDMSGLSYNPLSKTASLNKDLSVNYLVHVRKCDDEN